MTNADKSIHCVVYKSSAKIDTFLFVLKEDDFSAVPETLLKVLGQIENIMQLTLTPESRLARNNIEQVLQDLEAEGYHLQMPPPNPTI